MIQGVDRSHLNSPTPLTQLVKKGVKFVWFKGSQGETYNDPVFNSSWHEAKNTPGLIRGVYHFFDGRIDGIVQANNFISLGVDFSSIGCLPPCVDVEDLVGSNKADTDTQNKWVANNWQLALRRLGDFLMHVKTITGRDCIIYSYNGYMKEYFQGHPFATNGMWISSLQPTCPVRYDTHNLPEFWQYTYRWNGTDMDGNWFTGNQEQLNKLANINV